MQSPQTRSEPSPFAPAVDTCSIAGMGYFLPPDTVTNHQLALTVETSDEWIIERTGIHQRHRIARDEATSDIAHRAAVAALVDAGVSPRDLDLILLATATPDTPVPSTACYLQARLDCPGVPSMDLGAGCSGFGYGLHMALAAVRSGMHRRVLVVGADALTRVTNYGDRQSCILFGDGAGAAVVSEGGFLEVLYSSIGADGRGANLIRIQAGGSRMPASADSVAASMHTLELKGREVFKVAVRQMSECIRDAAAALGMAPSDFDLVIPHQANARIVEAVGSQLGVHADNLVIDISQTGNTAAASIPIALGRAREHGRLKPGQLVAVVGFGAGMAWACQVLRVHEK
ncbi:MAG: ketoacyl-ACP synthase III [Phycisphaerales bacterium]|nr:ketoacyl-ACP synthase III [Phycisphaerales bacterium]